MKPYYEHAGITIYHGDWRAVYQSILPQPFDLLLTDPPYGIGEANGRNKTRGGKKGGKSGEGSFVPAKDYGVLQWDNTPPTPADVTWMCSLATRQIIFGGNYFHLPPSKCWLVWDKVNGSNDFADCELAWTNLDKAVRIYRYMWSGMLKEQPEARFHPTQKPLALMKWCISLVPKAYTVLDPYMGSGTTLLAAKAMGLNGFGCEREEQYCESAAKRLAQEVLF